MGNNLKLIIGMATLLPAAPVCAYDWAITAHVTTIEASYLPTGVPFKVDASVGSCDGAFLQWNIRGSDPASRAANAQNIMSMLITAKLSKRPVVVHGNNAGCTVDYLHFAN